MNVRTMAWVAGSGLLVASWGVSMAACSSTSSSGFGDDGGGGGANGGSNGGAGGNNQGGSFGGNSGGSTGGSNGGATGGGGGGSGGDAGGGDCGKTPVLFGATDAGVYCPFLNPPKGAPCNVGEVCCEPKAGASTCNPSGTTCTTGDTQWECGGTVDCQGAGGGNTCCGQGTPTQDPACGYYFWAGFKGTFCQASCAAGYSQVCYGTGDCPNGQNCIASKAKGSFFGFCQ